MSGFPSLPKISPTSKILATGGGTEAQALSLLDMLDRCEVVFDARELEKKERKKKKEKKKNGRVVFGWPHAARRFHTHIIRDS